MLNWLRNLSTAQRILAAGLVVIGVAGGYWILNPSLGGGQITLPPVFQRFFGGPYEGFIQEWDELVEISSKVSGPPGLPEADLGTTPQSCDAAILAIREATPGRIAAVEAEIEVLDRFDQQVPAVKQAANGIADSGARAAAVSLASNAENLGELFRDVLETGKRSLELYLARLNNHPGCGNTLESVAAALAYNFETLRLAGEILNPLLATFWQDIEALAKENIEAHQAFTEATGITLRPLGSLSREQFEDLLQE